MIFNKSFHGALYKVSHRKSEAFGGLPYFGLEVYAYTAHHVYR